MSEQDEMLVPIHEAAHCVVGVALGLPVSGVQIGDHPCFDYADAPGPERRVAEILTLMAGCEAESALLGREPIGGGFDDARIAELLDGEDEAALRREVRLFLVNNLEASQEVTKDAEPPHARRSFFECLHGLGILLVCLGITKAGTNNGFYCNPGLGRAIGTPFLCSVPQRAGTL